MNAMQLINSGHACHTFRGTGIHSRPLIPRQLCTLTRSSTSDASHVPISPFRAAATGSTSSQLIKVTIKKPLGLVLAERDAEQEGTKEVFVEEIVAQGNAAKTGQVQVGDVIACTSATVLKSNDLSGEFEREGHGKRLYDNWKTVEFDCANQEFNTVMAAIASNNERWGIMNVTLTLRRSEEASRS